MSSYQYGSAKYILVRDVKLDLGMQVEAGRGEVLEGFNQPNPLPGSVLPLFDRSRGIAFSCPTDAAASLTDVEAGYITGIFSLEDRYKAFKEGVRFDHLPDAGSKVFVAIHGREFPGVVRAVSCSFNQHFKPIFEVGIQRYITGAEAPMTSECSTSGFGPKEVLVVIAALDMLRPRNEASEVSYECLSAGYQEDWLGLKSLGKKTLPVGEIEEPDSNRVLSFMDEQRRRKHEKRKVTKDLKELKNELNQRNITGNGHEQTNKNPKESSEKLSSDQAGEMFGENEKKLMSTKQDADESNEIEGELVDKEKPVLSIIAADESKQEEKIKDELNEGQKLREKENEKIAIKQVTEDESKQEEKIKDELNEGQKLREKENEKIAIKQVTEDESKQKEKIKDELKEMQIKLARETKAKEEAEKKVQEHKEKLKELQTTLAEAQSLLKEKKPKTESVYEWILSRDEIHLTEEKLGSGSFGTVFKGKFRGTQVAVKQVSVKPRITDYNMKNFRREMRMAARCRHPCMLQFIGATSDDQSPLLVTELMDTSLKEVLLERELNKMEIKTIALDVAKGLNYLHLTQPDPIIHRDISSGNVLLWQNGQSWRGKLSDYGNAVLMNYAKTGSGGALSYLAPEIDNKRCSTKSDVYSFGVLLLELCLRDEPSSQDDRDRLVCKVEDGAMRQLIRRCIKPDPTQRPSMEDVLADLELIEGNEVEGG